MKLYFSFLLLLLMTACGDLEDPLKPGALVPLTVAEDSSLPAIAVNGTLLHAEAFGNPTDPIIAMIHGGPGGDYSSLLKARAFTDNGFYVVFYDQRGSGLSRREDRSQYTGTQVMVDDLDAVIRHFRADNDQKLFLVGHSWGAMLASAYVDQYPDEVDGF